MNFSRQREIIYDQVMNYPTHPTVEEVYNALKPDNPNLSLGTVYRNLNQLSEAGMLMKIPIADGSDRFDGRTDCHYHMICDKCGRVFDIELDCLDEIPQTVMRENGHRITRVTLNLKGVCAGCLSKEDPGV
ncbi:MAG: transcriptional repressor [Oscillospiraceae bacterium]|nr:transcriptional repressor [Oscillospiraceae bacterium]